ncbi:MAG: cytochrome c [Anaerolineales bacterium]|nr:cytochrome c [Anaerolineales bacterium]
MKKVIYAVLLLSALILTGCGSSNENGTQLDSVPAEYSGKTNPFGADAEAVAAGKDVFLSSCQTCHGPQGHGDGPASGALNPAPKNLAELQAAVEDDYLFWRISTGKDGTSMIAWEGILTEEQIWQVVSFIRTLK